MAATIEFTVTKLDSGAVIENVTGGTKNGAASSEAFAMSICNQIYSTLVTELDATATDATITVELSIS